MYGPDFAADPAAAYQRMRRFGPAAPVQLAPGVDATLITGYQAALSVLRSPETFVKDPRRWRALANGQVPMDSPVVPMMMYRPNCLFSDGEEHRRLRQVVTDSLERIDPNELRGYVEESADTLIDQFCARGEADLLAEYARAIPMLVANHMFGCPPDVGERLLAGMSGIFDGVDAEKANEVLTQALVELVALKRAKPGADVTSWMMAHPAGLTDEEMLHQLVVLMGAGTEPEQNLIANGMRLLLSDDRFAGSLSGGSLPVDDALDEVLWTDPPMANYAVHYAVHDVDFSGLQLREGEPIMISFAAANTDPTLASDQRAGNRAHLAWSAGPHACPAQSSARLAASVAVEKLLDRLPDLELAVPVETLMWRPGPFHRALIALPVRFPPVAPLAAGTSHASASSAPALTDETSGETSWNASPAPSSSTPPAATFTAKATGSAPAGRRRWWNSLAGWWRGR
ncbi:cytochrome P450 [Streptomyces zagrosensis]|nr:cytochrome P450 [Streptomyces zagrosensis]